MDKNTQKELQQIVKKNYEQIADHYSETRKKYLWEELHNLTKNVPDGARVLDVGCGSGKLINAFLKRKIDYLGIDPCVGLLDNARENFPEFNFQEGDILRLGEVSSYDFDYVYSIAVLQHIPGLDLRVEAIRQLRNKIKDDGKIIISVWNMWKSKKYKKLIYKFFLLKLIGKNKMDFGDVLFDWKNSRGKIVSKRYYHAFRKGELKKICRKAGVKIEKIYKKDYNYYLVLGK